MDVTEATHGGFAIDVSSEPLSTGAGYAARVVVRELPSHIEKFSERASNGGLGWPTQQQALGFALARGRMYVLSQAGITAVPPLPADP